MIASQAGQNIADSEGSDDSGGGGGGSIIPPVGGPTIFTVESQGIGIVPQHNASFNEALFDRSVDGNIAPAQGLSEMTSQFKLQMVAIGNVTSLGNMTTPPIGELKDRLYGKAGGGPVMMG
jgi:hypothetical protein